MEHVDPFIFGIHKTNLDELGCPHGKTKEEIEKATYETNQRTVTVLMLMITYDMFITQVLMTIKYLKDDVMWSFATSIALLLVLFTYQSIYFAYVYYLKQYTPAVKEKKD